MSVSIVMACYNEEEIIETVVRDYHNQVIERIDNSEFIIIDDCSSDQTPYILAKLVNELPELKVLRTQVNLGHGKAIRMGYETAQKEWVFQVDSDNQFKAEDFWLLYKVINEYDFILGFRKNRQGPLVRLILTGLIRFVNFLLFRVWIKDANCPFRLIKRELLHETLECIDTEALAPNIMISILIKKKGMRMKEVPISHYERKTGVPSIKDYRLLKFGFKGFRQLLLFNNCLRSKL